MAFNDTKQPGDIISSDDWNDFVSYTTGISGSFHTHKIDSTIHFIQPDITTVGTISEGVWHGSPIEQAYIKSGSQYYEGYTHSQDNSIHLTPAQKTDLTDGGDTTLHYHSADRNLANATGVLAIGKGGTNNTSYTANKFLVYDGSKIASSTYDSSSFAAASHTHNASDITAGALALARGGLGKDVSGFNGLVKIAGGNATYITDNSSNWNAAYNHSQITTGNPHDIDLSDIGESKGSLTVSSPLSINNSVSVLDNSANISISQAGETSDGYISSNDWKKIFTRVFKFGKEGTSTTSTSYVTIANSDIAFDPDDFKVNGKLYMKIVAHLKNTVSGKRTYVRVYRQNAGAAITGTEVYVPGTTWQIVESSWVDISSLSGAESFQIQMKVTGGTGYYNSILMFLSPFQVK